MAALRGEMLATPPGVAAPTTARLANRVMAIVERYPELKTNESFLALHRTQVDADGVPASSTTSPHYNNRLEIVPERFVDSWAAWLNAHGGWTVQAAAVRV